MVTRLFWMGVFQPAHFIMERKMMLRLRRSPNGTGARPRFRSRRERGGQSRKESFMTEKTVWDSIKAESGEMIERVRKLVREGNVRRIVAQYEGRTIAEFPVTAGVVGAVLAPRSLRSARSWRC